MKYLIINGSPRRKNTWSIVNQVKSNLKGNFDEIHLSESEIGLCKGCYNCMMNGEMYCPHSSEIKEIIDKIDECDGLIITSPVYAMNVTALLKNFIDHTAYLYHRPQFFTKKALVVVSTAGAGHKKVADYLDETLRHWGVNKVYKIAVRCGGMESIESEDIDKTAQKFRKDVESMKVHSPKLGDIIFFDVWKAMAVNDSSMKTDKKFWEENNLVNNDFSPEVELGFFKKVFSRIMFHIMKKVI